MDDESREERTFAIVTLGCKLNQYESECIRQSLEENGWVCRRFEEGADVIIVNSCTVTGRTDSRCRNAIRRARRISQGAKIVVTGCYSETQPERLRSMPEVDLVLGNADKSNMADHLSRLLESEKPRRAWRPGALMHFSGHSRAFIKVQEGCNANCSYCVIPRARGRSRSVPADDVVRQVRSLEENGYNEIVLTGIHIGRYGLDLCDGSDLTGLVERIIDGSGVRVRLSSIEANEISGRLIALVAGSERLAAHMHIPMQSGDDRILAAMRRTYRADEFSRIVRAVKEAGGHIAVGTDIIVGFPGENDEQFDNTFRLAKELPIDYFHVFNFSRRPGTEAETMDEQVDAETKKRRSRKLIRLGAAKRRAFMKARIGSVERVLVQGPAHRFSRFSRSLTGNYCEVYLKAPGSMIGKMACAVVTHYSAGRLYGSLVETGTKPREAARDRR